MANLTEGQKQALFLDRNISVTAGAGAGKTFLLVERFLKIAVEHYKGQPRNVRRILAITFTNKAAGEMKERIAQSVNERIAQTDDPQLRKHLLAIRDQLNSVAISTIHAFCTRLLREFPIEAGLAPDFSELDDMQATMLSGEAIDQALQQLDEISDAQERSAYERLFEFWDRRTVVQMLRMALQHPFEMETILEKYEALEPEDFLTFINDLWLNEMRSLLSDERLRYWLHLIHAILQAAPSPPPNALFQLIDALQACTNLPEEVGRLSVTDFQNLLLLGEQVTSKNKAPYKSLSRLGGKKSWPQQIHHTLLELSEAFSDWLLGCKDFLPGEAPGKTDLVAFEHLRTFLNLYRLTAELYEAKKREIPAIDFEDLLLKTYRLLRTNEAIRSELSRRYEFIMVDEFQDTNALQWEIIRLLAEDENGWANNKIFIVGDPKQSIYGFRNADIRIFRQAKTTFAHIAGYDDPEAFSGNVILKESFRFLPSLNAFINDLFAHLLQARDNNDYEVPFQALEARRQETTRAQIELALLDAQEALSEEAYIAETIRRLTSDESGEENVQLGDIAVLLRSRNNLLAIEQALRDYGIPFKTVKGIGYWQQQEIYDFYHLLRFLAYPEEDFSLIGILRSKLFLVADDVLYFLAREPGETFWQKLNGKLDSDVYKPLDKARLKNIRDMLKRWIRMRHFLPLHELLEIVLDDLHYRALLTSQINGEQLLANIEKFIEHVFRFNNGGILGLMDLIRQVELFIEQNLREGEPQINLEDKSTVKLMTIHAAKGLQFPVVFIPYLNTDNLKKSGATPDIFLEASVGLAAPPRNDLFEALERQNNQQKLRYALLDLLKLRQKKKDLAEAKRIFYVGVTRARNHLFLSAKIKKNRNGQESVQPHSALQWINEFFTAQNRSLFDQNFETYERDQYTVQIIRTLDQQASAEVKINDWLNKIELLKQHIFEPKKPDEVTLNFYRPLQDTPGAITFSATRLMTYRKDPREYYRRYHLGFFESDYELFADTIYKSDDSLIKGKILHRFLQLLSEKTGEAREIVERVLFEYEVFDPQKQEQFRQEILLLNDKIANSPIGRKIITSAQARNEIPVTMRLGDDYFTGTIDRIILDEQGLWRVIDYKTNRLGRHQIRAAGQKYEDQMKGYALLLSRLLPEQQTYPVDLYFIYPDDLYSKIYTTSDIREIEQEFLRIIEEIKTRFPLQENSES